MISAKEFNKSAAEARCVKCQETWPDVDMDGVEFVTPCGDCMTDSELETTYDESAKNGW